MPPPKVQPVLVLLSLMVASKGPPGPNVVMLLLFMRPKATPPVT